MRTSKDLSRSSFCSLFALSSLTIPIFTRGHSQCSEAIAPQATGSTINTISICLYLVIHRRGYGRPTVQTELQDARRRHRQIQNPSRPPPPHLVSYNIIITGTSMQELSNDHRIQLLPPYAMSRQIATLLLGICGLFLVSSAFLHILINQIEDANTISISASPLDLTARRRRRRDSSNIIFQRQKQHQNGEKRPSPDSQRTRYEEESSHVDDPSTIEATVQSMRLRDFPVTAEPEKLSYDVKRCPDEIPQGYPAQYNVLDVLTNWNPDNTSIPHSIYQGVCMLDWKDPVQRDLAEKYRQAELPFVLQHHPEVWRTAERWSHYDYLETLLGDSQTYKTEHSQNNHLPYWKLRGVRKVPDGWTPPTENVELSFPEWYAKAIPLEEKKVITEAEHYYFRLNGAYQHDHDFLYDELPIFLPTTPSFFMPEPKGQRGINCRFGSKGIIAETHYDYSRNFILILKGQKRYVLSHPDQCSNLELHEQGHPSARHSRIDWSNPKEWHTGKFPQAMVNEVILQAGDALYLPTAWFHFIVSLNLNYQCNARSGMTDDYAEAIEKCGFGAMM